MSLENFRQKFKVYVVDEEQSSRELIRECLTQSGYNVESFSSSDLAFAELHSNPPHVILTTDFLTGLTGIDFLQSVQKIAKEIQFVFLEQNRDISMSLEMLRSGAYGIIRKPIGHIPEIVVTVDRAIEKVFLNFKNEQLIEELERKEEVIEALDRRLQGHQKDVLNIQDFTQEMKMARDLQDAVTLFLDSAHELIENPLIFFRHAPTYNSIVYSQSVGLEEGDYKNLGINFKEQNEKAYPQNLKDPSNISALNKLIQSVFNTHNFEAIPLIADDDVLGIVVALDKIKEPPIIRLFFAAFEVLAFKADNIQLQKRLHDSLSKDKVTGLFDKKAFYVRFEEEMSRAVRLQQPLSLIHGNIDHMEEYTSINGISGTQLLLKMVSNLIKKSSRKTDVLCHFGDGQFAILLPNTENIGAAFKAEKLRRIIESAQFPNRHLQPMATVTMSLGVSDYPKLSTDMDSLVFTAEAALEKVRKEIFNRVCISKDDEMSAQA